MKDEPTPLALSLPLPPSIVSMHIVLVDLEGKFQLIVEFSLENIRGNISDK